ncbi:MAG: hypothetical protein IT374_21500 [Polyangiaceae bacterium]|nr:hypothetical protein [Polyangiaceae bacterium]
MIRLRSLRVVSLLVLTVAAAQAQPSAEDKAAAESLFRDGRRLMDEGKTADGCRKLGESQRLDPAPGTLLNLAVCHEKEGKVATAWAEFQTALSQAKKDGRADREDLARERIAALEPLLPKLTLVVPTPSRLQGLVVTRNGSPLQAGAWGTALAVDPGEVLVEATAPGYKQWRHTVQLAPKGAAEVQVPVLEKLPDAPAMPPVAAEVSAAPAAPPPPPRGLSPRSTAGVALAGAGAVSLGVGVYFGVRALSKRSDSDEQCPKIDGRERCSVRGVELNDSARSAARASNLTVGLGLLAVGAGAYLFFADPSREGRSRSPAVAFGTDGRSAHASLGGTF